MASNGKQSCSLDTPRSCLLSAGVRVLAAVLQSRLRLARVAAASPHQTPAAPVQQARLPPSGPPHPFPASFWLDKLLAACIRQHNATTQLFAGAALSKYPGSRATANRAPMQLVRGAPVTG